MKTRRTIIHAAVLDYYGFWHPEAQRVYDFLVEEGGELRAIQQIKRNLASTKPKISRKTPKMAPRMKV